MSTLTIKIPAQLGRQLEEATRRAHITKSELVRRALAAYMSRTGDASRGFVSALEQAGDLVGCFAGGPSDLSTNLKHLDDFGKV